MYTTSIQLVVLLFLPRHQPGNVRVSTRSSRLLFGGSRVQRSLLRYVSTDGRDARRAMVYTKMGEQVL